MLRSIHKYQPQTAVAAATSVVMGIGGVMCLDNSWMSCVNYCSDDNPLGETGNAVTTELDFDQDDTRIYWPDWR